MEGKIHLVLPARLLYYIGWPEETPDLHAELWIRLLSSRIFRFVFYLTDDAKAHR
jgi:hypothetical protein